MKAHPVLVVEDDDNDAFLLERALCQTKVTRSVRRVCNGQEAIDYLRRAHQFADREAFPFPAVIFLDLKLPGMDGFHVLEWLQAHPECAIVPTIVFSSSNLPEDVQRAYRLGANCYMVKPSDPAALKDLIGLTFRFWAACARPDTPDQC